MCVDPSIYEGNRAILVRRRVPEAFPDLPAPFLSPAPGTSPLPILTEDVLPLQDMFAAAVSLVTGKILYISNQVASIFHCKRDTFHDAKFVEFLAPHDISVFHSSTTPYKLPPWSVCSGTGEGRERRPPHLCLRPAQLWWPLSKGRDQKLFRINLERKNRIFMNFREEENISEACRTF